jgi:hypothetical protein
LLLDGRHFFGKLSEPDIVGPNEVEKSHIVSTFLQE